MLSTFKNHIFTITKKIVSSIAFYPTIISLFFLILSFLVLSLESQDFTEWLQDLAPILILNDADTARAILTTLIGGILSFTVFSFSMVMLLLSQASSNFSPRLLPGLISDKRNQIVLGIYLGTIIYNIIVLVSISPSEQTKTINGFSIILGITFGILCLAMFVFFIHSISTGIQINNILDEIFDTSKSRLNSQLKANRRDAKELETASGKWYDILTTRSGCLQEVNIDGMLNFMESNEVNVKILQQKGAYLLPFVALFKVDKELEKDLKEDLVNLLIFSSEQKVEDNYVVGMKQVAEVGIKAMSPGINDPGTALITIDYITELLALRMKLSDCEIYLTENDKFQLDIRTKNFSELMYEIMAPYRQYCKHDFMLMRKLVYMLNYLRGQDAYFESYKKELDYQIEILTEDIKSGIQNTFDEKRLLDLI